MAITISTFLSQVNGQIDADDNILSEVRRYRQIRAAVERYSRDLPDDYVEDVTGDGGRYYDIASKLTYWSEGFSDIVGVEYPAATVSSDETPQMLDDDDWQDDYWSGGTRYLYFPNHEPASTETIRVKYTIPYTWTAGSTTSVNQASHGLSANDYIYQDSDDNWQAAEDQRLASHQVDSVTDSDNFDAAVLQTDIPTEHFFAICKLASAYCLRALANKYAKMGDSNIAADSTNRQTISGNMSSRAKELVAEYEEGVGLDEGDRPAGDFVDWDTAPGWPHNRQFIFHGKETR
jgi:hypothetical protein